MVDDKKDSIGDTAAKEVRDSSSKKLGEEWRKCRIAVVGSVSGKSSLLKSFLLGKDKVPCGHEPTVFEAIYSSVKVFRQDLNNGQGRSENYDMYYTEVGSGWVAQDINPHPFSKANAFVICFSLVSRSSFDRAVSLIRTAAKVCRPGTPCLLCGTLADVAADIDNFGSKDQTGLEVVPEGYINSVLENNKRVCIEYLTCSLLDWPSIDRLFRKITSMAVTLRLKLKHEAAHTLALSQGKRPKKLTCPTVVEENILDFESSELVVSACMGGTELESIAPQGDYVSTLSVAHKKRTLTGDNRLLYEEERVFLIWKQVTDWFHRQENSENYMRYAELVAKKVPQPRFFVKYDAATDKFTRETCEYMGEKQMSSLAMQLFESSDGRPFATKVLQRYLDDQISIETTLAALEAGKEKRLSLTEEERGDDGGDNSDVKCVQPPLSPRVQVLTGNVTRSNASLSNGPKRDTTIAGTANATAAGTPRPYSPLGIESGIDDVNGGGGSSEEKQDHSNTSPVHDEELRLNSERYRCTSDDQLNVKKM